MALVAALPHTFMGAMPCGDANRNGRPEIFGTDHWCDTLTIFEYVERDSFRKIATGLHAHVASFGDPDRDGRTVLIAGTDAGTVLYKALSPDTFPTESIWALPGWWTLGRAGFANLDGDEYPEMIFSCWIDRPKRVFECRGQSRFDSVPWPSQNSTGEFCIDDFDQDGRMELVDGTSIGFIHVFECTGDDSYIQTYDTCIGWTWSVYHFTAPGDMDQDGLPEFIVLARQSSSPDQAHVIIYEEPQHNSFRVVWHRTFPCAMEGRSITSGDVNQDGVNEFAFSTGIDVRLFTCVGPDSFEEVWYRPAGADRMRLFDVNSDGRDELILGCDSCLIYEDTTGLSPIAEHVARYRPSLPKAQPSVSIRGAPVLFTDMVAGSTVTIYNSSGAVIRSELAVAQRQWRWDLTDNRGQTVPTGTYFAAVGSCGQSSRVKLCIVK